MMNSTMILLFLNLNRFCRKIQLRLQILDLELDFAISRKEIMRKRDYAWRDSWN